VQVEQESLSALVDLLIDPPDPYLPSMFVGANAYLPQCWVDELEDQLGLGCGNGTFACLGNGGEGTCGQLPPGFTCEPGATGPRAAGDRPR